MCVLRRERPLRAALSRNCVTGWVSDTAYSESVCVRVWKHYCYQDTTVRRVTLAHAQADAHACARTQTHASTLNVLLYASDFKKTKYFFNRYAFLYPLYLHLVSNQVDIGQC